MRARFITLEGGEGTGKSTQAAILAKRLSALKNDVTLTREPGGSPNAEAIRALLVAGDVARWSAEAEALLNYAARDAHLRETIRPTLGRGGSVVCDRFMDSTRAYQGAAGGCSLVLIDELERRIVGPDRPHLTLIFDLPAEAGLARALSGGRAGEDRFERKGLAFHQKLRQGFLAIAAAEPARCRIIDASPAVETVAQSVWQAVEAAS